MNMLVALTTIRNASLASNTVRTRHGAAALKVVDRKIVGLLRKKAWRDQRGQGGMPEHMTDPTKLPPIPDDPATAALRRAAELLQKWKDTPSMDQPVSLYVATAEALEAIRAVLPPPLNNPHVKSA